jgi:hypothetical protein
MADTTLPGLLGTGIHASRPAAADVGSGGLYSCTTHGLVYQTDGSSWTTWATLGGTPSGSITSSGYTQNTARLLGRTTGSAGAIEEITVGTGLSLSAGALTATGGAGSVVPSIILDFTLGSDINGTALTNATWVDVLSNQNFTVANASSVIQVTIRGYAFNNVAVGQCGTRFVIDSAGTPINEQITSTNFQTNGVGNLLAAGSWFKSGLTAAVHTIKVQCYVANATPGNFYCRASSGSPLEFMRIQIIEHLPA